MIPTDHEGKVQWATFAHDVTPDYFGDAVTCMTRAIEFTDAWANFIVDHADHPDSCMLESAHVMFHKMIDGHPVLEKFRGTEDEEPAKWNIAMQTLVGFAELMATWAQYFAQSYAGMEQAGVLAATENKSTMDWLADFKGQFRAGAARFLTDFTPGPDHIAGAGAQDGAHDHHNPRNPCQKEGDQ